MARFPQAESQIAALALMIMDGLTNAAEDFPTPPVSGEELQARLDAYNEAKKGAVRAEAEPSAWDPAPSRTALDRAAQDETTTRGSSGFRCMKMS
jgi:hypothetical protein